MMAPIKKTLASKDAKAQKQSILLMSSAGFTDKIHLLSPERSDIILCYCLIVNTFLKKNPEKFEKNFEVFLLCHD